MKKKKKSRRNLKMGLGNSWKHLRRDAFLVLLNIGLIIFAYLYMPVSTLVMFSSIPAVIYSIYTKRYFLILLVGSVYAILIVVFVLALFDPDLLVQGIENVNLVVYLYKQLYPYEISVSVTSLLSIVVIVWISIAIYLFLFLSRAFGFDEFKTMIVFSFVIVFFSSLYFIFNIFTFIIPYLKPILIDNFVMKWIFSFFYIWLPFVTLNFIMLFMEDISIDHVKRGEYKESAQKMRQIKPKRQVSELLKIMAIITVIILVVIILVGIM